MKVIEAEGWRDIFKKLTMIIPFCSLSLVLFPYNHIMAVLGLLLGKVVITQRRLYQDVLV